MITLAQSKLVLIAILTLAWAGHTGWAAGPELHGNPDELASYLSALPKLTSIAGSTSKEIQADQAVVSVRATTEAKSLSAALKENQQLRHSLIQSLVQNGINADRIQTSKFSSIPEQGKFSARVRQYKVENQIRITIDNEKDFQVIASKIDAEENLHFQDLQPKDSQDESRDAALLEDALDVVLAKQKILETKLGITLVPKQLTQQPVQTRRIGVQGGSPPSLTTGLPAVSTFVYPLAQGGGEGSGFGQFRYTANIIVTFAIQSQSPK